ncbi:MAG: hypothetical protein JXB39_13490 [Deltaproteobacteria bacterium]|nr:hypothetical protein [Deltaproteobacteria bacterium]
MVDGGGLYHRAPTVQKDQRDEVLLKAGLMAETIATGGVDAMGLTPDDLAIGWDQVLDLAKKHTLPYVAANLTCGTDRPFPASRVVERNGVKIGFVGTYLGAFPGSACTVGDPLATTVEAVNALPEVDAVVVVGGFDAEKGKALADLAPRVSFIVSGDNLNLPDPQPLTPDIWLLGSGSRGRSLGVLDATLVPGATGWQTLRPGASVADRIDRFRARLKTTQERLANATDPTLRKRTERQIEFYEKEIARMETELQAVTIQRTTVANTFSSDLVSLGRSIADHSTVRARLDAAGSELAKCGGSQTTSDLPPALQRPPIPIGIGPVRGGAHPTRSPGSPEAPKAPSGE